MTIKGQWSNWYADRRWRAIRRQQLDKEPLCRYCMHQGKVTVATICDHVEPHKGDREKFWNGERMSLCKPCHDSVKRSQEATGIIKGASTKGTPLDPSHPWNKVV